MYEKSGGVLLHDISYFFSYLFNFIYIGETMLNCDEGKWWLVDAFEKDYSSGKKYVTKTGNEYHRAKLKVIDNKGEQAYIYDNIYDKEKIEKIINSAGCIELKNKINSGKKVFIDDLIGLSGKCLIGIEEGKNGYPDKNIIECYLRATEATIPPPKYVSKEVAEAAAKFEAVVEQGEDLTDIPF